VSFDVEVIPASSWADRAAMRVAKALPRKGTVIITGGTSAGKLYPRLVAHSQPWSNLEVFFSDERCVPPDHPDSNYRMARTTLLDEVGPKSVHRMRGEDEPSVAADAYDAEMRSAVARRPDVLLLGMGADGHIAALFPNSPALEVKDRLCAAVNRPDGMQGLTLTPPALASARRILLVVTGAAKARAVERALTAHEGYRALPARLLAEHENATFLVDAEAARALRR
jgi:6-phosphogluconolactonase